MKRNRFASYLLTGKAATLPFMFNSSFADVVPSYTDILSNRATLIEVPATGVRLYSIFKDNNNNNNNSSSSSSNLFGGSSYGGTDADAVLCSTNLPTSMNIVITGAKPGDTVYLVASSNKEDGSFDSLNTKIRVGSKNFSVVTAFTLAKSTVLDENGGSYKNSTSPISIPIALSNNAFVKGGTFYFQAVIFPNLQSSNLWKEALYTELDQISVSTAGCPSTSGSTYGSGSAY